MTNKDYYEVLGVTKQSTSGEIKKAYRKKAIEYHPDKNPDVKEAEENFKIIAEAYEVLSNEDKKALYDQIGHKQYKANGGSKNQSHGFNQSMRDSFNNFFNRKKIRVGTNLSIVITLTLEEIFSGVDKTYNYKRETSCTDCGGHGGSDAYDCPECDGTGIVNKVYNTPMGYIQQEQTCSSCNGVGIKTKVPCKTCNSKGSVTTEETVEITIPSGVMNGMVLVNERKGNVIKSGGYGDLHIKIFEKPHEYYTRLGKDLKLALKLDYHQLVFGDKVEIKTIEETKIRINIPEGSDVGSNLKIPFKGITQYGSQGRGDVIITLSVKIPKNINEELKTAVIALKEILEKSTIE
jgi:molecular chaperone DnaJ